MATSAIPAALDGLVALCTAQTGPGGLLDGVQVFDGPPLRGAAATGERQLYLGDTPDDDSPGVTGAQTFGPSGRGARDEEFSIYCTAISRSGDTDIKVERDRAFAIVAAVEQLVRAQQPAPADTSLGGAVMYSAVGGEETYTPIQTDDGAYVDVGFTVACRARI